MLGASNYLVGAYREAEWRGGRRRGRTTGQEKPSIAVQTSVQFKMVCAHSRKPICASPHLSEASPVLLFEKKKIKHLLSIESA